MSVPDALAMAAWAALPAASFLNITASVSYQAPISAFPSFGFALSVAVLTTMRSMISPGILLESNTSCAFGDASTALSCGFQVTTAVLADAPNAATMSASDVLTIFRSRSRIPALVSARTSR